MGGAQLTGARGAWAVGISVSLVLSFAVGLSPSLALRVLQRLAVPFLFAALTLLACFGVGRALRLASGRLLAMEVALPEGAAPRAFDTVVGLPLYGCVCFVVGLVAVGPWSMALCLCGCAALGAWYLLLAPWASEPRDLSLLGALCLGLMVWVLGLEFLKAQGPPSTLDELAYHLAVVRSWALEGRVLELPLNSHSYFPFGAECASLPLLTLAGGQGAVASHLVHWTVATLVLCMAYRWLQHHAGDDWAWLGTALVATVPALLLTAGASWVDWPLLGACLAVLCVVSQAGHGSLSAAALTTALAAGLSTKYTFAPFAVLGTLALWTALPVGVGAHARSLVPVIAGGALGSTFFVRNLLATGNPLSPFGDPQAPVVQGFASGENLWESLARHVFDRSMVDESMGLSLVPPMLCLIFAARLERARRGIGALGVAGLLGLGLVLAQGAVTRILVPFATVAALCGLAAVARWKVSAGRAAVLLLLPALVQAVFIHTTALAIDPLKVVRSGGSEHIYLSEQREAYRRLQWLEPHLPVDSRTLVLGIQELYWLGRRARGGGNADGPRVAAYLSALNPGELSGRWRRDGFTHVAVYAPGLIIDGPPQRGLYGERRTGLTSGQQTLLRATLSMEAERVASAADRAIVLYRLRR